MSPMIEYKKEDKILSIRFKKGKSVDSDIRNNVVIDYDKKGDVVNIDVMEINLANFVPVRQMNKLAISVK